jgi:DNA repair protein RadC
MKAAEAKIVYTTIIKNSERLKISTSETAYNLLKPFYDEYMDFKESSYIVMLNRNNKVLGVTKISEGGVSGTVVDLKLIFQAAFLGGASGLILSHNHPSGNLKPSSADISLTKKAVEVGNLVDMPVLDHIILTSEGYYSLTDNGDM